MPQNYTSEFKNKIVRFRKAETKPRKLHKVFEKQINFYEKHWMIPGN